MNEWKEPLDADDALIQVVTSNAYDDPRALVLGHTLTYEDAKDLSEKLRIWIKEHTHPYGFTRNTDARTEAPATDSAT